MMLKCHPYSMTTIRAFIDAQVQEQKLKMVSSLLSSATHFWAQVVVRLGQYRIVRPEGKLNEFLFFFFSILVNSIVPFHSISSHLILSSSAIPSPNPSPAQHGLVWFDICSEFHNQLVFPAEGKRRL